MVRIIPLACSAVGAVVGALVPKVAVKIYGDRARINPDLEGARTLAFGFFGAVIGAFLGRGLSSLTEHTFLWLDYLKHGEWPEEGASQSSLWILAIAIPSVLAVRKIQQVRRERMADLRRQREMMEWSRWGAPAPVRQTAAQAPTMPQRGGRSSSRRRIAAIQSLVYGSLIYMAGTLFPRGLAALKEHSAIWVDYYFEGKETEREPSQSALWILAVAIPAAVAARKVFQIIASPKKRRAGRGGGRRPVDGRRLPPQATDSGSFRGRRPANALG